MASSSSSNEHMEALLGRLPPLVERVTAAAWQVQGELATEGTLEQSAARSELAFAFDEVAAAVEPFDGNKLREIARSPIPSGEDYQRLMELAIDLNFGLRALEEDGEVPDIACATSQEVTAIALLAHPTAVKVSEAGVILERDLRDFRLGSVSVYEIDAAPASRGKVLVAGTALHGGVPRRTRRYLEAIVRRKGTTTKALVVVIRELSEDDTRRVSGVSWYGAALACIHRHPACRAEGNGKPKAIFLGLPGSDGRAVAPGKNVREKLLGAWVAARRMSDRVQLYVQDCGKSAEAEIANVAHASRLDTYMLDLNDPALLPWKPSGGLKDQVAQAKADLATGRTKTASRLLVAAMVPLLVAVFGFATEALRTVRKAMDSRAHESPVQVDGTSTQDPEVEPAPAFGEEGVGTCKCSCEAEERAASDPSGTAEVDAVDWDAEQALPPPWEATEESQTGANQCGSLPQFTGVESIYPRAEWPTVIPAEKTLDN